jgi:hypothetical protein
MNLVNLVFWLGTFSLIILTYSDFKKMKVDARKNYFMYGLVLAMVSIYDYTFWYFLFLIGLTIGLSIFITKLKLLGKGDVTGLRWLIFAFGIISPIYLTTFLFILMIITALYGLFKFKIYKLKEDTPFYHVYLISFVLTALIFGLYLP